MDQHISNSSVESQQILQIPSTYFIKLLEVIELAARRGAFEIDEYKAIGELYSSCRKFIV